MLECSQFHPSIATILPFPLRSLLLLQMYQAMLPLQLQVLEKRSKHETTAFGDWSESM